MLNPVAPERLPVKILNTSARGVYVGTTTFLPPGAEVRVFLRNIQLFGKIRYCVPNGDGFRVGIALTEEIRSPPTGYQYESSQT